jgi:hypothetical protein
MRVLLGAADCTLHDITTLPNAEVRACLDPDSYAASRLLGAKLRGAGSDGLHYPSVRHKGGQCIAVFWPNVVGIPIQERHLQYEWDGKKVTRYFDYSSDEWQPIPWSTPPVLDAEADRLCNAQRYERSASRYVLIVSATGNILQNPTENLHNPLLLLQLHQPLLVPSLLPRHLISIRFRRTAMTQLSRTSVQFKLCLA